MDEADRLCDRIAIIDHGKIAVLGSPDQLKKDLGGDIVRMRITSGNTATLKDLDYVKNVKITRDEVILTVRDAGVNLQEILNLVGKVDSVEVRPLTLEDVFLHYTGKAIREGTPEGGWAEKAMHAGSGR
jgi:ABC-2 type transport system ATP-binding protein